MAEVAIKDQVETDELDSTVENNFATIGRTKLTENFNIFQTLSKYKIKNGSLEFVLGITLYELVTGV